MRTANTFLEGQSRPIMQPNSQAPKLVKHSERVIVSCGQLSKVWVHLRSVKVLLKEEFSDLVFHTHYFTHDAIFKYFVVNVKLHDDEVAGLEA